MFCFSSLQSGCCIVSKRFQTVLWNTFYWECIPLFAMTKLIAKIVELNLQGLFSRITKGNVQLELLIKLVLPKPQHVRKLMSAFTWEKKLCRHLFVGFFSLWWHTQKVHNARKVLERKNVDMTLFLRDIDNQSKKEELKTCKHFLVDAKMENRIHGFVNLAMELLDDSFSARN